MATVTARKPAADTGGKYRRTAGIKKGIDFSTPLSNTTNLF